MDVPEQLHLVKQGKKLNICYIYIYKEKEQKKIIKEINICLPQERIYGRAPVPPPPKNFRKMF